MEKLVTIIIYANLTVYSVIVTFIAEGEAEFSSSINIVIATFT